MDDMKTIDAALVRLAKANHAEAGHSAHLIGQAQTLRQNMIVAIRRLRKVRAALVSQGASDAQLEQVNAEYTKACQTRTLMDNVLGAAFVVNARLGKGASGKGDGSGNDNGVDDGGNDTSGIGRFRQSGEVRADRPSGARTAPAAGTHGRGRFRASPPPR